MLIRDLGDGRTKIITVNSGCELVVTTDVLVDGVHFSDRTISATILSKITELNLE